MRVELGLAGAGIRHRPLPWLLLSLGVALAVAFPVFAAGLRHESGAAAITGTLDALPPYERTVLANTYRNLSGESAASLDGAVRRALERGRRDVGRPRPGLQADLDREHRRQPGCPRPDRPAGTADLRPVAERLQPGPVRGAVGPAARRRATFDGAARAERELGIVVTGTAELTDQRLVGVGADRGQPAAAARRGAGADRRPRRRCSCSGARSAGSGRWTDRRSPRPASIGTSARSAHCPMRPAWRGRPLSVIWPAEAVAAGEARAAASADRFSVLGAGAGALQLGLCLVVAAWLRRRQQLVGVLLLRRGGECGADHRRDAAAGGPVGASRRAGGHRRRCAWWSRLRARAPGVDCGRLRRPPPWCPPLPVLVVAGGARCRRRHRGCSLAGHRGGSARYVTVFALVASALLPFLVLRRRSGSPQTGTSARPAGRRRRVCCRRLAVVAVSGGRRVARPPCSGPTWSRSVAALVTCSRRPPARGSSLGADPLLPMVTAGFLAASCCLLVFTAGYRESLRQSGEDQAAFRVPLDVSVTAECPDRHPVGGAGRRPAARGRARDAWSGRWSPPPVTAFGGTPRALVLPLTGVDPEALSEMHEFRATTGASMTADTLAQRLSADRPAGPAAPVIPAGVRRITLQAEGVQRRHHAGAVAQHP